MNDPLGLFLGEEFRHARGVAHVQAHKVEIGVGGEAGESGFLQGDVVVVVEVIHPNHLVSPSEEALGHVHADEAGGSGEQDFHLPEGLVFWESNIFAYLQKLL